MEDYNLPRYFYIAQGATAYSDHKKPMGVVIVHKKIHHIGWNKQKTHPIFSDGKKWYSIHAEIDAILRAKTELKGAEIYVFRESLGKPAMAKPCTNCLKILIEVGIKRIYFTTNKYPYYEVIEL